MIFFRIAITAAIVAGGSCALADDHADDGVQSALAAFENDKHGDLHSVIVIQNGEVAAEKYFGRGGRQTNEHSIEVFFASGNGGNKIYVIPEFDLVVSIMSTAYGQGRGQRRSEDILKAILATSRPTVRNRSTI